MQLLRGLGDFRVLRVLAPSLEGGLGWVFLFTFSLSLSAQQGIIIKGNVYGGGNQARVGRNTTVTVNAGDINEVYGGARMADVGGRTFVNLNGEKASGDIMIKDVYGGNDISGHIGADNELVTDVPEELDHVLAEGQTQEAHPMKNAIDNTWKTFVRSSRSTPDEGQSTDKYPVVAGAVFGGGNGNYYYDPDPDANGNYYVYLNKGDKNYIASSKTPFNKPEIAKTYLELTGGLLAHVYGGGNFATVTENTTICIDNKSTDLWTMVTNYADQLRLYDATRGTSTITGTSTIPPIEDYYNYVLAYLVSKVDLPTFQGNFTNWDYHFARVFGGNNKADMAIQPTWNLQRGKIRDLYSGGNNGRMTHPNGLLLDIHPAPEDNPQQTDSLKIENVYGGCRMADVRPKTDVWDDNLYNPVTDDNGDYEDVDHIDKIEGYYFPANLAARTLIRGGDINNVYGGNDIRGKVYFGNAVGVATSIRGNVYGGGNGAYAYTDNNILKDDKNYSDFHYSTGGGQSAQALNDTRPDAEQVSILIRGKDEAHPTIIGGSVYLGGNCATMQPEEVHKNLPNYPLFELKIGSYMYADKVFFGNNGEGMVKEDVLKLYAGGVDKDGNTTLDKTAAGYQDFSTMELTQPAVFAEYMKGAEMPLLPKITTESIDLNGDRYNYVANSSHVGSLYCGGNVGSMSYAGTLTMNIEEKIHVFDKIVGGCNNANVTATSLNAAFNGGILGATDGNEPDDYDGTRIILNCKDLNMSPERWKDENDKSQLLEWNTAKWVTYKAVPAGTTLTVGKTYYRSVEGAGEFTATGTEAAATGSNWFELIGGFEKVPNGTDLDLDRRLLGANIYGGCYYSGHVNGNVVINVNNSIINRKNIFSQVSNDDDRSLYDHPEGFTYNVTKPNSGVILDEQGMDVYGSALNIYGGGYGKDSEIWGSTTVNVNKGYVFQVFGGSDQGVIGKSREDSGESPQTGDYEFNGKHYAYNPAYSTTVNLNGERSGTTRANDSSEEMAESEFFYGGGFEGPVIGDTHINLGNGRIFNTWAGACNGDVLGHTETHVGEWKDKDGNTVTGFPWIRDYTYGGNDLGGSILNMNEWRDPEFKKVTSSYIDYVQGYALGLLGGCFGDYDYAKDPRYNATLVPNKPYQHNAVIYVHPTNDSEYSSRSYMRRVFGAGEGYSGYRYGDQMQDHSYINIAIPDGMKNFKYMEVFGAGMNNGLGMRWDKDDFLNVDDQGNRTFPLEEATATIDLMSGQIAAAYGGSYEEGVTLRTEVNVPKGSTIKIGSIFGGAYGTQILPPCDVYDSHVNYHSADATLIYDPGNIVYSKDPDDPEGTSKYQGAIYGGNNNERRALYTQVNIDAPVVQEKIIQYNDEITGMAKGDKLTTNGNAYGAGFGIDTWSEYTEVNLFGPEGGSVANPNPGAKVYEVYGGGQMVHVLNSESVQQYMYLYKDGPSPQIAHDDPDWNQRYENWHAAWKDAWTIGEAPNTYFEPNENFDNYATNAITNLSMVPERPELDDKTASQLDGKKYNTNVIIHEGAQVQNYAFGAGLGDASVERSGDVYGTTYIALLGGTVRKDIYAGGTAGGLDNLFGAENFTATANAYIQGGMCRNVYGGGYEGHVGHHVGDITTTVVGDLLAKANVVIGKVDGTSWTDGIPAILRNVYGGGEGGSVYGSSHVTLNNGMIGYRYMNTGTESEPVYKYVEELDDRTTGDNQLETSGNIFGGGYVVNSYVDETNINMYGGTVRGSLFGGGEIGPIGRGTIRYANSSENGLENGDARIFKAGKTHVNMFNGHVLRNVFGGGRGKDNWGGDGTMYMDPALVATLDLQCKGFVFGQTEVNIHGGEIGTAEGVEKEQETGVKVGNVFGGGDEGTVYSAYMEGDKLYIGKKDGVRYEGLYQGYYYKWDPEKEVEGSPGQQGEFITHNVAGEGETPKYERYFTEDCKVLVEPWLQVTKEGGITYDGKTYAKGDYIPTAYLNTLGAKSGDSWPTGWNDLDTGTPATETTPERQVGINIHNAIFAGGNLSEGSNSMVAEAITVYGNATASIHDVYNRDFVTIGTGYTGGLYGDGNLTFVDGYRELNVTNYGTDYYHIDKQLDYDKYNVLPEREKAYYEVKYKCKSKCTDVQGTTYTEGSNLPLDELVALFLDENGNPVRVDGDGKRVTAATGGTAVIEKPEGSNKWMPKDAYWEQNGVVTNYAGRILNTIQRADLCGVFGSRMVMKGARDRVVDNTDKTNYTINRVREVSLNKKQFGNSATDFHGNYFGIYSNVNYLGALSSDVSFDDVRKTKAPADRTDLQPESTNQTFYEWKSKYWQDRKRNNGTCHNLLALASGVYLELISEKSTGTDLYQKDWGLITGVVELDLINVTPGVGGGFVYAKNEHGVRSQSGNKSTTLTALNDGAVTHWDFLYDNTLNNWEEDDTDKKEWQTSGNFINSSQTIIDDCYNVSNKYKGKYGNKDHGGDAGGVPAHYWYISGTVYVYDQYITAYTGSPNAFSETVDIPVTINAASHGTMTLMDVQPNLYAYYSSYTDASDYTKLSGDSKVVINDVAYTLNTPISYWDWYKLPAAAKKLFVEDTYIVTEECKIGDVTYAAGTVLTGSDYNNLLITDPTVTHKRMVDGKEQDVEVAFDEVFRSSNNMAHNTGYALTYKMTNPDIWNQWYTEKVSSDTNENGTIDITERDKNQTGGSDFEDGPTYHPTTNGLYGQKEYATNDIIPEKIYTDYVTLKNGPNGSVIPAKGQATFQAAYIVTQDFTNETYRFYSGAPIPADIAAVLGDSYCKPAYVCTHTIQLPTGEFIYVNDLMTGKEKQDLIDLYTTSNPTLAEDINKLIVPAYYCTGGGLYGGDYYEIGKNYRALTTWSSMSKDDRKHFTFNYDALDLLIDPTYGKNGSTMQKEGTKYQYDGENFTTADQAATNSAGYSLTKSIDYSATYKGTSTLTYNDASGASHDVAVDAELSRTEYESLPNEQRHYSAIPITDGVLTYYVVKETFVHGEKPYAVGTSIDAATYETLSSTEKGYISTITFTAGEITKDANNKPIPYYYCRESYKVNENGEGVNVTSVKGEGNGNTYTATTGNVPLGAVITKSSYDGLTNRQKNFTIHGVSPTETSTLYVTRNADINDLSTEKIITVIYKYDYDEVQSSGTTTPVSERHIVNIHIQFESGMPTVEDIYSPDLVLPGTSITIRPPRVTSGAYEVIGGGWELFNTESDAESHTNGKSYTPVTEPLYWYQDGFYLAYYAKTYNGKAYSNHVPVSVANYHDLKKVMEDKTYHLHVDYDRTHLKRDSKIYINDYTTDDPATSENGLDLFKDLYNLSLLSTGSTGVTNGVVTAEGRLEGHTLLNNSTDTGNNIYYPDETDVKGVKGGTNLEFFMRTDIDHSGSTWTPIGSNEQCFEGNIHGDGHTISGLDNSLFYNLCGSVYNLGVTGSFSTAGVVDKGKGYVESCWIHTTGTPDGSVAAVFGNPTATNGYKQNVNSYCQVDKTYNTESGNHGLATPMSERAFYNGEVTFNLNNFYLYKRYNDNANPTGSVTYKYWKPGGNTINEAEPQDGSYADNADLCSSGYNNIKYVEERYADGDFRYEAGVIPTTVDKRLYLKTETDGDGNTTVTSEFYPIWPDDYIFFGQTLTYGHMEGREHQDLPSTINLWNRVYRAPAYFQSYQMGMAHFNADAVFAQSKKNDSSMEAYKDMTAIDFTGYNDATYNYEKGWTTWSETSQKPQSTGMSAEAYAFFPPLLDDGGLTSFLNADLTKNLLAYTATPGTSAAGITGTTVGNYLMDEPFAEANATYRTVDRWDSNRDNVHGHWVQKSGDEYMATRDHMLVDKQDFNAPIRYTFAGSKRMWYQRTPDNFVDRNSGWDAISLPFSAELVTTNLKGEITHFNGNSEESKNGTRTKIGHEYWLRGFTGIKNEIKDGNNIALANFTYPTSSDGSVTMNKVVTNTFLWDYYYNAALGHNHKDKNLDTYQTYYKKERTYNPYPMLTAAVPYLIGFPGVTYYEFDLSGLFKAQTTADPNPEMYSAQTVTFASPEGTTIYVSDEETVGKTIKVGNTDYTFKPNYLNKNLSTTTDYALNPAIEANPSAIPPVEAVAAGKRFDQITSGNESQWAFRPYFTTSTSSPAREIKYIEFTNITDGTLEPDEDMNDVEKGALEIYSKGRDIYTVSHLKEDINIVIVDAGGATLTTYTLKPGKTITTRVKAPGTYLVNKKKLYIK